MYSLDSTVSSDEFQSCSDHSDAESSSRSSSNDTEEQVINYDDSVEPVPTQEEVAHYVEQLALEDEEEQTLLSRFFRRRKCQRLVCRCIVCYIVKTGKVYKCGA